VFCARSAKSTSDGGPIELEQMDSAAAPPALHCLHAGRRLQRRSCGETQIHELDGPAGRGSARLDVSHRYVFIRAPVRREVAERATRRLNRNALTPRRRVLSVVARFRQLANIGV